MEENTRKGFLYEPLIRFERNNDEEEECFCPEVGQCQTHNYLSNQVPYTNVLIL